MINKNKTSTFSVLAIEVENGGHLYIKDYSDDDITDVTYTDDIKKAMKFYHNASYHNRVISNGGKLHTEIVVTENVPQTGRVMINKNELDKVRTSDFSVLAITEVSGGYLYVKDYNDVNVIYTDNIKEAMRFYTCYSAEYHNKAVSDGGELHIEIVVSESTPEVNIN